MTSSLTKLDKMIELELESGCENRAVIGGLEQVLSWWPQQARQECTSSEQAAIIDRVIELIRSYGTRACRGDRAHAARSGGDRGRQQATARCPANLSGRTPTTCP